jgi:hypothetical protein
MDAAEHAFVGEWTDSTRDVTAADPHHPFGARVAAGQSASPGSGQVTCVHHASEARPAPVDDAITGRVDIGSGARNALLTTKDSGPHPVARWC